MLRHAHPCLYQPRLVLPFFFVDAHRAGRAIFKCLCVYIHFVHAFVCMRVRVCVTACMQVCMCVCACVIVCIYIQTCIFFYFFCVEPCPADSSSSWRDLSHCQMHTGFKQDTYGIQIRYIRYSIRYFLKTNTALHPVFKSDNTALY